MYVGRDFKRDIELDKLKKSTKHLRPNRSWLDLFSLSLSNYFFVDNYDFTILIDNLSEDEVIVIDSHDDIFKDNQIQYWNKNRISDILPAIKCPSFKSETKIFKTSKMKEMKQFIYNKIHTKSIMIENKNEEVSINLVYGDTIKITPKTFSFNSTLTNFLDKLKERYKLWEIYDCACEPKKIRVWVNDFEKLKNPIEELGRVSNINDVKLGMYIDSKDYERSFSNYDTMVFNHSARRISDKETNLIFTGDTLAIVEEGNYYNFRLDERSKKSIWSHIKGKIL